MCNNVFKLFQNAKNIRICETCFDIHNTNKKNNLYQLCKTLICLHIKTVQCCRIPIQISAPSFAKIAILY